MLFRSRTQPAQLCNEPRRDGSIKRKAEQGQKRGKTGQKHGRGEEEETGSDRPWIEKRQREGEEGKRTSEKREVGREEGEGEVEAVFLACQKYKGKHTVHDTYWEIAPYRHHTKQRHWGSVPFKDTGALFHSEKLMFYLWRHKS